MPASYRRWQTAFRAHVPRGTLLGRLAVRIVFTTRSGRMRPDIDNAAGAVLDALQPDTIPNDRNVVSLFALLAQGEPSIAVEVEPIAVVRACAA